MYTKNTSRVCCGLLVTLLSLTTSLLMSSLTVVQAESLRTSDHIPADITYQEIEDLWANGEKRELKDDKSDNVSESKSADTNTEANLEKQKEETVELAVDTRKSSTTNHWPHIFKSPSRHTRSGKHIAGTYPTRKGVILVTKDKFQNIIPLGHAAIIYGHNLVIEAFGSGVQYGKNDWHRSRKTAYGISVKKTTEFQDAQAAEWCKKQIGKPYNFNYLNVKTRDCFYCSQLIWAAYLDNYGINIDTSAWGSAIHPSEILNSNEVNVIYRQN